jgi:hypothetical protein
MLTELCTFPPIHWARVVFWGVLCSGVCCVGVSCDGVSCVSVHIHRGDTCVCVVQRGIVFAVWWDMVRVAKGGVGKGINLAPHRAARGGIAGGGTALGRTNWGGWSSMPILDIAAAAAVGVVDATAATATTAVGPQAQPAKL